MICVPNGLVEIRWFKQLNQNFDHEVKLGLRSVLDRNVAQAMSWKSDRWALEPEMRLLCDWLKPCSSCQAQRGSFNIYIYIF